ncbi:MAG: penicillin-binding protein [Candidatus Koribacter versatilis]|uniref:Penicillin-binding protein n=1 Tax=Candidatus Korobacter versatilis TaxID=658062 RepID=A0A932EQ31_9BACT|nr:penicillin-binding protein [Candidatus Koribacter versatilis]
MKKGLVVEIVLVVAVVLALVTAGSARSAASKSTSPKSSASTKVTESTSAQKKMRAKRHSRRTRRSANGRRHRRYYERFYLSSYADDVTAGDKTAGEDPIVRAAAVEALGNMNGTVVAIDPTSGRVLAMVNQKLALSEGAQPCSTIKLVTSLAALNEGIIDKDTEVPLSRRWKMTLTHAIATSNNTYFEVLGRKLGFEKVAYYARQLGLGELAGYNIEGEHLGAYPDEVISAKDGGVGKMSSYGEGISMTPLQLGALVSAIANGGTLYYMQHPTAPEQVANFKPRIKRQLAITDLVPQLTEGMAGTVEYGTGRSVRYNFSEEQVLGKTGTCSKDGTRFGWFASYANTHYGRIVTVVFLHGGRPTFGPKAAEIAGRMYRNLYDHSFFAAAPGTTPDHSEDSAVGASH